MALLRKRGGLGILIPWLLTGVAFAVGILVGIGVHAVVSWPTGEPAITASAKDNQQTLAVFHGEDSPSRWKSLPAPDSVSPYPRGTGRLFETPSILETINSAVVRVSTGSTAEVDPEIRTGG